MVSTLYLNLNLHFLLLNFYCSVKLLAICYHVELHVCVFVVYSGILSLFMIEIMVKLWAFRLDFFRSKLEVFDALVVIISFCLDIAFLGHGEGVNAGVGLLVVLRLWRVTRILNGKHGLGIAHDNMVNFLRLFHIKNRKGWTEILF